MKKFRKYYNSSFAAKMTFILCLAVLIVFGLIYSVTIYRAATSILEKEKDSAATKVSLYSKVLDVMGVDLEMKELTEEFSAIISKDDAKSSVFLLGKDGKNLINADKDNDAETYITDACENHGEDLEEIERDMLAGNDGTRVMVYDGEKYLVSYAFIPNIECGIAICKPYDIIYEKMMLGLLRTVLMLLVTMVLVGFLIWHIVRRRTQPIRSYAKSAAMIAEGDFDSPLQKAASGDEIQQLGDSLDNMRVSLKDYVQKLTETTAVRQSMAKELSIAHDIQMGMLPHNFPSPPEYKDVDVFAFLQPAKEVGGDLYDFMIIDGKLYFIIGDVSGKGVPASLVMAITISLFRAILQSAASPADVVDRINNAIAAGNERNMFVTLIVGELNLENGHLRFCNAGHDPMLLLHGESLEMIEMATNLPVGVIENFPYKMNEVDVQPGNKLVLYTDGVVEAENPDKQLYSTDRLVAALEKNMQLSSKEIIEMITSDVRTYVNGADQSDDITIMSIHYIPNESMSKEIIFLNKMEEVKRIAAFIDEIGEELKLDFSVLTNIQLAIEEAVVNVISYAYPDNEERQSSLSVHKNGNTIVFVLSDSGIPFDPTAAADPDLTLSAEERPIGGLGIMLVKKMMNEVTYQRIDGKNELTMKKEV